MSIDRKLFMALPLAVLLAACAAPTVTAPENASENAAGTAGDAGVAKERGVPADFPAERYRTMQAAGEPVLRIDGASSWITIKVRRTGSLAHLGHDHVIASRAVQGYVAPGDGRADLYFALDTLSVDEPALRKEAGFASEPSAADIEGTRSNMLGKVLQAERYPYVEVAIRGADPIAGTQRLDAWITLHGVTQPAGIAVKVTHAAAGLEVTGEFRLKQSDYGIVPFSILNGALQVDDTLDIAFRIRAQPS